MSEIVLLLEEKTADSFLLPASDLTNFWTNDFSIQYIGKFLPMTGFEPRISGVGSNENKENDIIS